jgi:hypothetical protein
MRSSALLTLAMCLRNALLAALICSNSSSSIRACDCLSWQAAQLLPAVPGPVLAGTTSILCSAITL